MSSYPIEPASHVATLDAFTSLVEAAKHYPWMKKAWVEFLGEKPDSATERVE